MLYCPRCAREEDREWSFLLDGDTFILDRTVGHLLTSYPEVETKLLQEKAGWGQDRGCFAIRGWGWDGEPQPCQKSHKPAYLSPCLGTWKLPAQHTMCQIYHFVCQRPLFPLLSPVLTKGWKIVVLLRQNYCWGEKKGGQLQYRAGEQGETPETLLRLGPG